jgi:predicted house-cleaning noncanonical NTP pyrophosphatase (MazG superfamily)
MTKAKKTISLEETIQEFVESQKEMNLALVELLEVMKRIFNGERSESTPDRLVDNEIEQTQLKKYETTN